MDNKKCLMFQSFRSVMSLQIFHFFFLFFLSTSFFFFSSFPGLDYVLVSEALSSTFLSPLALIRFFCLFGLPVFTISGPPYPYFSKFLPNSVISITLVAWFNLIPAALLASLVRCSVASASCWVNFKLDLERESDCVTDNWFSSEPFWLT